MGWGGGCSQSALRRCFQKQHFLIIVYLQLIKAISPVLCLLIPLLSYLYYARYLFAVLIYPTVLVPSCAPNLHWRTLLASIEKQHNLRQCRPASNASSTTPTFLSTAATRAKSCVLLWWKVEGPLNWSGIHFEVVCFLENSSLIKAFCCFPNFHFRLFLEEVLLPCLSCTHATLLNWIRNLHLVVIFLFYFTFVKYWAVLSISLYSLWLLNAISRGASTEFCFGIRFGCWNCWKQVVLPAIQLNIWVTYDSMIWN